MPKLLLIPKRLQMNPEIETPAPRGAVAVGITGVATFLLFLRLDGRIFQAVRQEDVGRVNPIR